VTSENGRMKNLRNRPKAGKKWNPASFFSQLYNPTQRILGIWEKSYPNKKIPCMNLITCEKKYFLNVNEVDIYSFNKVCRKCFERFWIYFQNKPIRMISKLFHHFKIKIQERYMILTMIGNLLIHVRVTNEIIIKQN
jgi:hypothetical protein